ncbi:hypothetical protein [Flavobacterium suncheonense]|uniref:Uncharacterized protein n=1 Tax=Flavobacterium suncheonense GH29-5 = DSM 17707 TaxID=1121899 RepID=A0A0A2ME92_9FLAO|nr:hypothetical protein [Flavobacterium suncheonense]KGO89941.1 hypothetical protein Q764_04860 [Flavobacterium suncheonense GH29-5 = DSM 17707]
MKKILTLLLCFGALYTNAQQIKCEYDMEEKTDSTYLKKTHDYLIHEKDLGNNKDFIQFALINSDGTLYLNFQLLQRSKDFIKSNCFDTTSKISLQLTNGKIVTLISAGETCSQLIFDEKEKNNIRILNNYFLFSKDGYEDLKKYPISLMKVKYLTETTDYVFKKELKSDNIKGDYSPENYFINYLKCVE